MKRTQANEGAAMLMVVLFTLLLMAGILAASLRLSLGSRQNTADQAATLKAQYAAESSMALAQSKLRDIERLLSSTGTSTSGTTVDFLKAPTSMTASDLNAYALAFCGRTSDTTAWTDASAEFSTARSPTDTNTYPLARECKIPSNATLTTNNYRIIADNMSSDAYQTLPDSERPAAGTNLAQWWQNYLTYTSANVRYRVVPQRVVRLSSLRYRFYLTTASLSTRGSQDGSERFITANKTQDNAWWFEMAVPSPLNYAVFDNRTAGTSSSGGFTTNVFDGDFFTNQHVRFANIGTPNVSWRGNMYSAGCGTLPAATAPDGTDCTGKTPGYFKPGQGNVTTAYGTTAQINAALTTSIDEYSNFSSGKSGFFRERYIKLPITANNQATAASDRGLVLNSNEVQVNIFAGNGSGSPFTYSSSSTNPTYSTGTQSWNEPNPVYQYITLKSSSGGVLRELRYGADKVLYRKTGTTWSSVEVVRQNFNEVIYSTSTLTVSGPARPSAVTSTDPPVSQLPPALASFAKMNITSNGSSTVSQSFSNYTATSSDVGIIINSDITLSDTPCDNTAILEGTCIKTTSNQIPKNVLILFAPRGKIQIGTSAPKNVNIHAGIVSSTYGLGVNAHAYTGLGLRGKIKIIGSVVEDTPGLKNTSSSGYVPSYSYDYRFKMGILPEASPITMTWETTDSAGGNLSLTNFSWRQTNGDTF